MVFLFCQMQYAVELIGYGDLNYTDLNDLSDYDKRYQSYFILFHFKIKTVPIKLIKLIIFKRTNNGKK
jgi:hypothetical protein